MLLFRVMLLCCHLTDVACFHCYWLPVYYVLPLSYVQVTLSLYNSHETDEYDKWPGIAKVIILMPASDH